MFFLLLLLGFLALSYMDMDLNFNQSLDFLPNFKVVLISNIVSWSFFFFWCFVIVIGKVAQICVGFFFFFLLNSFGLFLSYFGVLLTFYVDVVLFIKALAFLMFYYFYLNFLFFWKFINLNLTFFLFDGWALFSFLDYKQFFFFFFYVICYFSKYLFFTLFYSLCYSFFSIYYWMFLFLEPLLSLPNNFKAYPFSISSSNISEELKEIFMRIIYFSQDKILSCCSWVKFLCVNILLFFIPIIVAQFFYFFGTKVLFTLTFLAWLFSNFCKLILILFLQKVRVFTMKDNYFGMPYKANDTFLDEESRENHGGNFFANHKTLYDFKKAFRAKKRFYFTNFYYNSFEVVDDVDDDLELFNKDILKTRDISGETESNFEESFISLNSFLWTRKRKFSQRFEFKPFERTRENHLYSLLQTTSAFKVFFSFMNKIVKTPIAYFEDKSFLQNDYSLKTLKEMRASKINFYQNITNLLFKNRKKTRSQVKRLLKKNPLFYNIFLQEVKNRYFWKESNDFLMFIKEELHEKRRKKKDDKAKKYFKPYYESADGVLISKLDIKYNIFNSKSEKRKLFRGFSTSVYKIIYFLKNFYLVLADLNRVSWLLIAHSTVMLYVSFVFLYFNLSNVFYFFVILSVVGNVLIFEEWIDIVVGYKDSYGFQKIFSSILNKKVSNHVIEPFFFLNSKEILISFFKKPSLYSPMLGKGIAVFIGIVLFILLLVSI